MSFDVRAVRSQFPILSEIIDGRPVHYLDNGASAQKPLAVLDRMDQVHRVEDAYLALPVEVRSSAEARAIRSDIAELRVNLWAQSLGTPHPVSEKRLLDRIAACARQ